MKVTLTRAHIDSSAEELKNGASVSRSCPVAIAIREALGVQCVVGPAWVVVEGRKYSQRISTSAIAFICRFGFDRDFMTHLTPLPMEFEIFD